MQTTKYQATKNEDLTKWPVRTRGFLSHTGGQKEQKKYTPKVGKLSYKISFTPLSHPAPHRRQRGQDCRHTDKTACEMGHKKRVPRNPLLDPHR